MVNIDKITAIVKKYYTEWELNPKRLENGYQYEQTYAEMMQNVERDIFALSIGKVTVDRNKKKTHYSIWKNRDMQNPHTF